MPKKDLYLILGVSPGAAPEAVRDAYRKLAKQHHPDASGDGDAGRFREIAEAYETLSDPHKRERYNGEQTRRADAEKKDRDIGRRHGSPPTDAVGFGRFRGRRGASPVEPIPAAPEWRRRDRFGDQGYFTESPLLELAVELTPEEALNGATDRFEIPVRGECPECAGSGGFWGGACTRCMGRGMLTNRFRVSVHVPAGVRQGEILDLPLRFGRRSLLIRLHVRIRRPPSVFAGA